MKSPNGKVQLNVIEVFKGEMNVTQIVLRPASDLKVDIVYTLQIDRLPRYERKPERYNNATRRWEQVTF